eukprot:SAG11_NODE_293_length_11144_cov_4.661928_7_plen_117_part_00
MPQLPGCRCAFGLLRLSRTATTAACPELTWRLPGYVRVDRLYDVFGALGLRYVLITHHGRLVGMVKKKDLLGRTQQVNYNTPTLDFNIFCCRKRYVTCYTHPINYRNMPGINASSV